MNKYEPINIGYTQFIIFGKQKKRIIILSLLNKVKTTLWKACFIVLKQKKTRTRKQKKNRKFTSGLLDF